MKPIQIFVLVLAVAATAGCSHNKTAAQPPAVTPTISVVTVPAPTATVTPEVTFEVAGKWYPQKFYNCAQALWNSRVAEWNKLVQKRDAAGANDVVVNGVTYPTAADYDKAKGWPNTFESTVIAAATKTACG